MPIKKRSRIVSFLFGWGHGKGGLAGEGALRGVHPKKYTCRPKKETRSCRYHIKFISPAPPLIIDFWLGR